MKKLSIILLAIVAMIFAGKQMYRYFVTDRTMDGGDIGNPWRPGGPLDPNTEVGETAILKNFSWTFHSGSIAGRDFNFSVGCAQWAPMAKGNYFNCEFSTEDGELVERRDAPLDHIQWCELEDRLRTIELFPYEYLEENEMEALDADKSCITVEWLDGEDSFTNRYNGEGANELYEFMEQLFLQTSPDNP